MAMQSTRDNNRRRRRQRGSQARSTAQTRRIGAEGQQFHIRTGEALASLAVVIVAGALIALIWISASRSIQTERGDTLERVEATLGSDAALLAYEIRRELLAVDQTLKIIKQAFEADPDHFDMRPFREQLALLMDRAEDVFISDENGVIQHDILPQAVGMGIGAVTYGNFQPGSLETIKEGNLLIGPNTVSVLSRQQLTYLIMRLQRPGGWLLGAAYRTDALTRLFAEAALGLQGMTALVNTTQGKIQAIAGSAAAPPGMDIANSPMFDALKSRGDGIWIGPSATDGVQRIHAFRGVPGRDLVAVAAVEQVQAMQPATLWAEGVRTLALGGTFVMVLLAAIGIREVWMFRAARRRRMALERERGIVASTQLELDDVRARADSRTLQFQTLLTDITEGVGVTDSALCLMEWNAAFAALCGVAPELLQPRLPLDALLRAQARAGRFGPLTEFEAEVNRRLGLAQAGEALDSMGPDGARMLMRCTPLPDGGLMLVLVRDHSAAQQHPPPVHAAEPATDPAASGPVETL